MHKVSSTMDEVMQSVQAGLNAGMNAPQLLGHLTRHHRLAALKRVNRTRTADMMRFHSEPLVALAAWLCSYPAQQPLSADTPCCYGEIVDACITEDPVDALVYYHIGSKDVAMTLEEMAEGEFDYDATFNNPLRRVGRHYLPAESAHEALAQKLRACIETYGQTPTYPGQWVAESTPDYVMLVWYCDAKDDKVIAMGPDVPRGMKPIPCDAPWKRWGGNAIIRAFKLGHGDDSGMDSVEDKWGNEVVSDWVLWKLKL